MRGKAKSHPPRVGIDLLGSDTAPELFFEAVQEFYDQCEGDVEFVVFGNDATVSSKFRCIVAKEAIAMEENPLVAVRRKKESSLVLGIRMLQKKELDAFVSAGNTGALIASAKMCLSMLPGIARPALLVLLPSQSKEIAVLDVGANINCKVNHLIQFASMGIAYQKSRGVINPTVGLLNIGTEQRKGTPELQEAYKRLQSLNRHASTFIGNIEGRDVFKGDIDVLITDGFTGNVFLKTAEGIANFILEKLYEQTHDAPPSSLKQAVATLHHRLNHIEFPGAILCGVEGVIVKCHGNSTPQALINGIKGAMRLVEHQFLGKIKNQLDLDKFS
jgi:glycerol-3-phosphate acyltransferase PlsX